MKNEHKETNCKKTKDGGDMELDMEVFHYVDILQMDGPYDVAYEEFDKVPSREKALEIGRRLFSDCGFVVRVTDSRGKIEWQS